MTKQKSPNRLVQPMFDGPIDVIGDVHGEIEALENLLHRLGYGLDGSHADGRRLVFLGDLIDRGPDSPAVVDLVTRMMERGHAQCIMGNHELNILRGKLEHYNYWFHGDVPEKPESPQSLLPASRREEVEAFFQNLPLALERPDLRAVHACWQDDAIAQIRHCCDAAEHFREIEHSLRVRLEVEGVTDNVERDLILQNENPLKLITSGPERRANQPFEAGGKIRNAARHPWWHDYDADALCVCGHYWRVPLPGKEDMLFNGCGKYDVLGRGRVMCIDYSVGGSYLERKLGKKFGAELVALRWPEGELASEGAATVQLRRLGLSTA